MARPVRCKALFRRRCAGRRGAGPSRSEALPPLLPLPVLLLVDAVDAPLLLLALAGRARVGPRLLVGQLAPQLQEAVVAGLLERPVSEGTKHGAARLVD